MRTAIRLLLLPWCILSLILFIHVFAARVVFSENSLKGIVSSPTLYNSLAAAIMERINENSSEALPITIEGSQVKTVLEPYLVDSIAYITGTKSTVPTLTTDYILATVFQGNQELIDEFSQLKNMSAVSTQNGQASDLEPVTGQLSTSTSLVPVSQLHMVRQLYHSLSYLPWIFLGGGAVLFLLIISICPDMRSRVSWVSFMSFSSALVLGVGTVFYRFSGSTFAFASRSGDMGEIINLLLSAILLPLFDTLARWNLAGFAGACCLAIIFFLARFMLFPKPASIHEKRVEKKEKKKNE